MNALVNLTQCREYMTITTTLGKAKLRSPTSSDEVLLEETIRLDYREP